MNTKNSIIIGAAIIVVMGAWAASSFLFAPSEPPRVLQEEGDVFEERSGSLEEVATTTPATATTTSAIIPVKKAPARIAIDTTLFNYDIISGTTPCGDTIGTVHVTSDDPSKELYWGMTGSMPIWLAFSMVEGSTPAAIDMTYNCVMSGAEEDINWEFVLVEKTKDGKYIDGYYRSFKIVGDIR